MPDKDTPPSSPHYGAEMDEGEDEEFFEVNEDELEEILGLHEGPGDDDEEEDEEEAVDSEPVLGPVPERDDALMVFSEHTGRSFLFIYHHVMQNGCILYHMYSC